MNHGPTVAMRTARPADGEAVADVYLAARDAALPHLPRLQTDAELRAYLAGLLRNPNYAAWVCERDGRLLGFMVLREEWVDHLYVRPGWQRRGIGSRLLDIAKRARPQGLRLFCLQCAAPARQFYQSRGLVVVRRSNAWNDAAHGPDVEYRWTGR